MYYSRNFAALSYDPFDPYVNTLRMKETTRLFRRFFEFYDALALSMFKNCLIIRVLVRAGMKTE